MRIKNIQGFIAYVKDNSTWQAATIRSVIHTLGHDTEGDDTAAGGADSLKDLSSQLVNVAQHGADGGFPGFIYYADTIRFFHRNHKDIVR